MSDALNTTASSEEVVVEKVVETTATAPAKEKAATKEKLVKVKFILSPTGRFGLGYNPGEKASLFELQAKELIEAGYAELVK